MPAITSLDLSNAKLDVDTIASVANSSDAYITDRLGNSKQTLKSAVDSIKAYNNRGVWVASSIYNIKDIVNVDSSWYICVVTHTSGSTFLGDGANWRVFQGDIFNPAGTNAEARPVTAKLSDIPSIKDFTTSQNAVDQNPFVFVPEGSYPLPSNDFGRTLDGPGKLMTPVDGSNLTKGYHQYVFYETDKNQHTFGEEYLFALHKYWKDNELIFPNAPPNIYLDGDSTVYGDYITDSSLLPQNALKSFLQGNGFNANIVNKGVSGATAAQFHMSDSEIASSTCIILSFGINNITGIETFVSDFRAVLTRIRVLRNYLQTTVVIKTSNACGATQDSRDETQAQPQRNALRQAARDFQCFFFDTAGIFADPRKLAVGTWDDSTNPPTQLLSGWMDDYHRTDPAYYDPLKFGCSVHPLNIGNMWIWGRLADALCTPGAKLVCNNNFLNIVDDTLLASVHPNTGFKRGLRVQRSMAANGFPFDGEVVTLSAADGTGLQLLYGHGPVAQLSFRQVDLLSGGQLWGDWVHITSQSIPLLIQSDWVVFETLSVLHAVKNMSTVTLGGALKNGTTSTGVLIATLPVGWRPRSSKWFTVPCGAGMDQLAVIAVKTTGEVLIQKCPSNGGLALDGITFEAVI